jgi:Na+/melibiose symporter-like transporter
MQVPLPIPFRRLAWSNLAAQSAEQLSLAAVPLVAVLVLGAGPGEIGLLAALQTLPFLLLAIPLGLLADRVSRCRLMVAAETLRALSLLVLLAMVLTGQLSIAGLALLGFIGAVGTVCFSVAAPALVPAIVPRSAGARQRPAGAGAQHGLRGRAGAGGALVAWAGAPAAFVLAAILSASAAGLLFSLREPARTPAVGRHALLEIRDGAQFVWRQPYLRPMVLAGIVWNIAWFVLQAAYVPYAVRVLGLTAQGVGITLGAYGAGMVLGALLSPRVVAAMPFGRAIQLGPAVSVLAAATMVATLFVPSGVLAGTAFFLFGVGPIVWTITSTTLRQSITPHAMLGRVSAVFLAVNAGARPVGAALGGLVGACWGEAACLWLALVGFALQAVVIFGSQLHALRQLPEPAG